MFSSSKNISSILRKLTRLYPDDGALHVGTPYHMVVLVALSARTRDEQILKLAPGFFVAFPTVHALAVSDVSSIMKRISTIGLYKQKAKNLLGMARMIVHDFDGEVPNAMDELVLLPGVGRKTASVVLAACFDVPAIAVDTHVFRVTKRLGWVKASTVEAAERALIHVVPLRLQRVVNQVFVPFGRTICIAKPRCWACPIKESCPFGQKNLVPPKDSAQILESIEKSREDVRRLKKELESSL